MQTRFTASLEEVREKASRKVQEAVVENEMAVARDKALDLYNADRRDEAVRQLREACAELKQKSSALEFNDLAGGATAAALRRAGQQRGGGPVRTGRLLFGRRRALGPGRRYRPGPALV